MSKKNQEKKRKDALSYHSKPKPGKLEVTPSKPYSTQRDLSLAYSCLLYTSPSPRDTG